jgi:hypothetical protein
MSDADQKWLLSYFINNLISKHPLPWTIDHDWVCDVYDAKGCIIMGCRYTSQAETLITLANKIAEENKQIAVMIEELLNE